MNEIRFIQEAFSNLSASWNFKALTILSGLQVPDILLGRRQSLLRADINEQWARWFVESLIDPRNYTASSVSYPHLFSEVYRVVSQRFNNFNKQEKQELASTVAQIIQQQIFMLYAEKRQRKQISRDEKNLLIDLAGDPPRCWICGGRFYQEAIDNFIGMEKREIQLPMLIDVLKPRGLKS